mgnify:CR=1 FL=1
MKPNPKTTLVTYGHELYNPGGVEIPDHLIVHEETHEKQQGQDPDIWWERYLKDLKFRLTQEVEAYGRQFAYICRSTHEPRQRDKILRELGRILSSPTYGNIVKQENAEKMILKKAYVTI